MTVEDGFRVRERVSARARGGLGFIYYSPNLKLKASLWWRNWGKPQMLRKD